MSNPQPSMKSLQALVPVLLALMAIGVAGTPNAHAQQQMQGIAAIVNDEVISTFDVEQRTRLVLSSSGVNPTQDVVQRIQAQVLRTLIDEKLQLQEAEKFEVEIEEAEVDAAIERLARQNNISVAEIERSLEASRIGIDTLRTQIRAELAWNRLVNGLLGSRVSVLDEEIDQILQQLTENSNKTQYLVSEILLDVESEQQEEAVYQGGIQLIQQMQQGVPFPVVAQQFSSSPTSAQGGDIGWVQEGELPEELNQVITQMQPGQISSPIRTRGGYVILALRDRRVIGGPDPMAATIDLAQILVPVSADADARTLSRAEQAAENVREAFDSCQNLERAARSAAIAVAVRLGLLNVTQLSPQFQTISAALRAGEVSAPMRTDAGYQLLIACDREDVGEAPPLPTRSDIEDRLYDQELSMLARRYLRDLRRDATIEMR
mgnify:CR=1 FL=1